MSLQPGDRIGDWEIDGPLGEGGMGSVYRGHNVLAPRILAAVKVVHPDPAADFRGRFVQEVEALESLEHPAIVRVKGWGEADGLLWLAMDLVEGEDLRARLLRGRLEPDSAKRVFRGLAAGLAHAHERQVFHRDIKPANVILQADDTAKIVDFGIALNDGRTRLSAAGMIPGTPAYLAPEVFGGNPRPRALDVYAFGQLLHEMLTGEPAFPEPDLLTTTAAIAHIAGRKLQSEPLDPGPTIPDDLRAIVRRTTHPDPHQRLLDLDAVVRAFDGEPLPDPKGSETMYFDPDEVAQVLPPPKPEPHRTPWWLMGSVAIGLLIVAGISWLFTRPAAPTEADIAVTGVTPDTPLLVKVNGTALEGENGVYRTSFTGTAHVEAWAGLHCDFTAVEPNACCVTTEVTSSTGPILISLGQPPSTDLDVVVPRIQGLPMAVTIGDRTAVPVDATTVRFAQMPPGTHTLEAMIGTCPAGSKGCAEECPPGCRSVVQELEVQCSGSNHHELGIEPPDPAPEAAPVPASVPKVLAGRSIRLIYMPGEKKVAERIQVELARRGAQTELMVIRSADPSQFGRVIPFGPRGVATAAIVAPLVEEFSDVRVGRLGEKSLEVDVVVWVRSNE